MTNTREFLIADITALLDQDKPHLWLDTVSDAGLYELWKDLVNLRNTEALYEANM
jgi:hypothetical protein